MKTCNCKFSVVVPCYNEEESLPALYEAMHPQLTQVLGDEWEVILVDDGSKDSTAQVMREIHARDERFKAVLLSRNFGHQPAISAGLRYANGEAVGIIDCDLQDPIDVLLELYQPVADKTCDVAYGIRRNRDAPWLLKLCYYCFYRFFKKMAEHDMPTDSGDFCVISRRALDSILALPEKQVFFRGLRSWVGFRQMGIPYKRPERQKGTSKYNFWRLVRLAINGFTGFSLLPLRLASIAGFLSSLIAILLVAIFIFNRFFPGSLPFGYDIGANPGTTTIVVLGLCAFSGIFFCLGIIGEYLAVIVTEVKARPTVLVAATIGDIHLRQVD